MTCRGIRLDVKDSFGYHIPVYTFENICIQDKSLKLNDEAVKIIINPDSVRDGLSEEMDSFLDLLQGKKEVQGLAGKLVEAVDEAKDYSKWRIEYMTMQLKLKEEREEGIKQGESRLNSLYCKLIETNRLDDLQKASKDSLYRAELYREFGLVAETIV